jgi:hypothetical protein
MNIYAALMQSFDLVKEIKNASIINRVGDIKADNMKILIGQRLN